MYKRRPSEMSAAYIHYIVYHACHSPPLSPLW
jgi:hypothetical protein